jgi:hypothetical protein
VGEKSLGSAVQSAAWGGRGWLVAVVAMSGPLLLMLPIAWAYVATRERRKVDHSVVTTITLLPIAVAAILVIVQDSLAIAFSLAGIAGLVRFRNSLDDTKDAMYVFIAIAVGLGAGVGAWKPPPRSPACTTWWSWRSGSGRPVSRRSPTSPWASSRRRAA